MTETPRHLLLLQVIAAGGLGVLADLVLSGRPQLQARALAAAAALARGGHRRTVQESELPRRVAELQDALEARPGGAPEEAAEAAALAQVRGFLEEFLRATAPSSTSRAGARPQLA